MDADNAEYASTQAFVMETFKTEATEYCRWQYYDVREKSFETQPEDDKTVWRYYDDNV